MKNKMKEKTVEELQWLVEQNNAEAIFEMGARYFIIQDYNRAIFYFEKDAKFENDYLLAISYYKRGRDKDYEKAYKIFNYLVINRNDEYAKGYLGEMYYLGKGVKQDYEKSYIFFKDLNTIESKYYIGRMYYYGQYLKQDKQKAIEIFEEIIKQVEDKNSLIILAQEYYKQQKYSRAFELCQRLILNIDENQVDALEILANMYYNGIWVKQDKIKAIEYFNRIIKNNESATILFLIGYLYKQKNTNEYDKKSFDYFMKSAKKGYVPSYIYIGEAFLYGKGVEKDYDEAMFWYKKGMKNSNKGIECKLGKININKENSEIDINKDIQKGIELLKTMANRGNRVAISVLNELDIEKELIEERQEELKNISKKLEEIITTSRNEEDIFLRNIYIINNIIKEYKVNGLNDIVLKKCEDIAEFTLKKDIQEYSLRENAKEIYQFLIILNLLSNENFNLPVIIKQCRDINKARELFYKNISKANYENDKIKVFFSKSIEIFKLKDNDETLKVILNTIDESFPKKKD